MAELVADIALRRGELELAVTLRCPPGITCVMGRSGAGKSTVLDVIAGLTTPDRGRITLGDEVWFDRSAATNIPVHLRRLAYVFQNLALFPHMSVLDNVMYGMPERSPQRAQALLDRMGVGALAARRPETLSGGEAQRVALARALARAPNLVLLDEPFSALDRELRTQLVTLVKELAAELAVPILHVTHSVAEARLLADRVIQLDRGKVIAEGLLSDAE